MNVRSWLDLPRRIPLAVRVALVMAPVILAAQFLTMNLMRHMRPVVGIYGGPATFTQGIPFTGAVPADPKLGPGAAMTMPISGSRVEILRLPPGDVRPLSKEEAERLGFHAYAPAGRMRAIGFRADSRGPPWQALAMIFLVTALMVWLGALWITRPLARLAHAAESLGRDVDQPPLADDGPPEVSRAAQAFNRMQDRLRRFLRGRADALLAMSHDLKTPITRLKLRLELLPEEYRAGIADDVNLLQSRIEHALQFMRGVHRDEPVREVALDALVATIVERMQDTGAQVACSGGAQPLPCRPGQLERAIANLIENSVMHAGSAEVEIGDSRTQAWIAVKDRGPGVPDALLSRLTEPFFRVDASRSRDSGGAGLGLAIVKDIVESHGGNFRLSNRVGGGLEARIELPRG
ncbi:MAG: ATP-binding protein [Panacagrimonas sp.]